MGAWVEPKAEIFALFDHKAIDFIDFHNDASFSLINCKVAVNLLDSGMLIFLEETTLRALVTSLDMVSSFTTILYAPNVSANCVAKRGRMVGQVFLRSYLSASSFASTPCQAIVA